MSGTSLANDIRFSRTQPLCEPLETRRHFALIYAWEAPTSGTPGTGISVTGASNLEGVKGANDTITFSVSGVPPHTGVSVGFGAYVTSDPLGPPDNTDKTFEIEFDGSGTDGGSGSNRITQVYPAEVVLDAAGSFGAGGVVVDLVTTGSGSANIEVQIRGLIEGQTWSLHMLTIDTITSQIVWLTVDSSAGNEGASLTGTVHRAALDTSAQLDVALATRVPPGEDHYAEGDDYAVPGSVMIDENENTVNFMILLENDDEDEFFEEYFEVYITGGGYVLPYWNPILHSSARITIRDTDPS